MLPPAGSHSPALGAIRDRTATTEHLKTLNQRYIPHFKTDHREFYIYLTTTNAMADQINQGRLDELSEDSYQYKGVVSGDFGSRILPTQQSLEL